MNDNFLQDPATEIIKPLVPPDAEERVNRSFKQWVSVHEPENWILGAGL